MVLEALFFFLINWLWYLFLMFILNWGVRSAALNIWYEAISMYFVSTSAHMPVLCSLIKFSRSRVLPTGQRPFTLSLTFLSDQGTCHVWLSQQTSLITTIFKKWTFLATLSGSREHFWQPEWGGFKHRCTIFSFKINTYINIPKPISSSWKVKVFTLS